MTGLCVACSASWPVAMVAGYVLLEYWDRLPRWSVVALLVTLSVSAGSCAAENRVCEIAGQEDG